MRYRKLSVVLVVLLTGCATSNHSTQNTCLKESESLSSWAEGPARSRIVSFVEDVTDPDSPRYVPQDQRRAFFDMDGTLLCERPHYAEVALACQRLRNKLEENPELAERPAYKAVLTNDPAVIYEHVKQIILEAFLGETLEAYAGYSRDFFEECRHPRFDAKYKDLFYVPMLELLSYLEQRGFTVYVVSTSQQEFIRSLCPDVLPVKRQNVVGTVVGFELVNLADDAPQVFACTEEYFDPYNADEEKQVRLRERDVLPGILAVGNSMGDFAMLDGVSDCGLPNLAVVLDHDDSIREYEYHKDALLAEAANRRWLVVSMKNDFRTLFRDAKSCPRSSKN